MGLFTGYLLYRAGKKRAQREYAQWLELHEICRRCGRERMEHSTFLESCPPPKP
jgi:hypothetical protein